MFDFLFYLALLLPATLATLSMLFPWKLLRSWMLAVGASALTLSILGALIMRSYEGAGRNLSTLIEGFNWSTTWQYQVGFQFNNLSAQMLLLSAILFLLTIFLSRFEIENSSGKTVALAFQFSFSLAALAANSLFFYALFSLCTIIPVLFLIGSDTAEKRTSVLKYYAYINMIADLFLVLVALFIHGKFRYEITSWFKLEMGDLVVLPNALAFLLFCIACLIKLGIFPFHFYRYELFTVKKLDTLIPTISGLGMGFVCLFHFGPQIFAEEFKAFSSYLAVLGVLSALVAVISLLRAETARQRVMQLQLLISGLVFLGFCSLNRIGWTGSWLMAVFQIMVLSMLIALVVISERRVAPFKMSGLGGAPFYAIHSAYASIAAYGMPISVGFYAFTFVFWGVCASMPRAFIFSLLCVPLIMLSSIKMIFFKIRGGNALPITSQSQQFPDVDKWEMISVAPPMIGLILFGIYPDLIIRFITVTVDLTLVAIVGAK